MKNLLTTAILILFFIPVNLSGQNREPEKKREQYEAQKIAFISKKVNFTVQEAQLFWPHYNELKEKRTVLQKRKRQILQKIRQEKDKISDKELEKLSDELIDLRFKEAQFEKVYHEKFKGVLPIKKLFRYYLAEEQFKTFFVRQMRNNNRPSN